MSRVAEKLALSARLAELETQLAQGRAQALAAIEKKSAALRDELKEVDAAQASPASASGLLMAPSSSEGERERADRPRGGQARRR